MEVDCWDGPNGEPIVYHGHTFTSKILFRDVVLAVEKYAFKVSPASLLLPPPFPTLRDRPVRIFSSPRRFFYRYSDTVF